MIDEDILRNLMEEAAEAVPAPGRSADALMEAITAGGATVSRRRPSGRVLVGAAAAMILLVIGAGALLGRSGPGVPVFQMDAATENLDAGSTGGSGSVAYDDGGTGGTTARSEADARAREVTSTAPQPSTVLADTAKVIKTGSLDLEVPARGFEPTVERITSMAIGLGGYVAESTTSESGDVPRGSITLRIPASSFDQLLTDLRKLGDVKAVTTKGTDVTAQFTDLAARLSALTATRDRLFEVLRGARNIGDIIAVQDRITGVQTEIEQLQGQQGLLQDQTSFGTLAVTFAEPGADEIVAASDEGLGAAWDEARQRFGDSVEGLIAWSGSAAVVVIAGLVVLGLGWLVWARGRRRLV